jgi:hypothetical protein
MLIDHTKSARSHNGTTNVPGGKASRSDGLATRDRHVSWRFSARYICGTIVGPGGLFVLTQHADVAFKPVQVSL